MRGRAFIDLRNVYKPDEVSAAGFDHFGIGIGGRRRAGRADGAADAKSLRQWTTRPTGPGRPVTGSGAFMTRLYESSPTDPGDRRRRVSSARISSIG